MGLSQAMHLQIIFSDESLLSNMKKIICRYTAQPSMIKCGAWQTEYNVKIKAEGNKNADRNVKK